MAIASSLSVDRPWSARECADAAWFCVSDPCETSLDRHFAL